MAAKSTTNVHQILSEFTKPEFLEEMMTKFDNVFSDLNVADKFLFKKYDKFEGDVQSFKDSLLKFVLDAQAHLSVLKENMASDRFQQQSEEQQLKFIQDRLNRINKETLIDYIHSCKQLIKTSIALHNEYGTKLFKVKFVILHMLGFTAIGAAVAFTIGLVLPFLAFIEIGVGVAIGALVGLGFAIYQLVWKWDERMEPIEKIRGKLKKIHDRLVDVEQQLLTTYKAVAKSQLELKDQVEGSSYLTVKDLYQYVIETSNQFVKLEKTLLNVKFNTKDD